MERENSTNMKKGHITWRWTDTEGDPHHVKDNVVEYYVGLGRWLTYVDSVTAAHVLGKAILGGVATQCDEYDEV